jgi:hypothetical protein
LFESKLASKPPTMAPPTWSAICAPGFSGDPASAPNTSSCAIRDTTQSNFPLVTAALQ